MATYLAGDVKVERPNAVGGDSKNSSDLGLHDLHQVLGNKRCSSHRSLGGECNTLSQIRGSASDLDPTNNRLSTRRKEHNGGVLVIEWDHQTVRRVHALKIKWFVEVVGVPESKLALAHLVESHCEEQILLAHPHTTGWPISRMTEALLLTKKHCVLSKLKVMSLQSKKVMRCHTWMGVSC